MVEHVYDAPWSRKHDDPRLPPARVPEIVFPRTLEELADVCREPGPHRLKAAGSHWALSDAALSEHTHIETRAPSGTPPGLTRTLHTAVPFCLHDELIAAMSQASFPDQFGTFVHVESGKRVCQLYAELDEVDPLTNEKTLGGFMSRRHRVGHFAGPWGFRTLGGAGGQTVVGALTTGTHGGDFDRPPIADSVVAVHLVADGGTQYWIERVDPDLPQLFDDDKLHEQYGRPLPDDTRDFHIVRSPDNELFDAVLVSAGRFGVIYSVVLNAVPQYSLWERRRLHLWQNVKTQIANREGPLFTDTAPEAGVAGPNHFLQVVVCLTTHLNFSRNLVGVTKRWAIPVSQAPEGRAQRVGARLTGDDEIDEPAYELVGNALPYAADEDHPYRSDDPSFLDRACANGGFMRGVLQTAHDQLETFVATNGTVVVGGVAAAAAAGGAGLLGLLGALGVVVLALKALIDAFDDDDRLGDHMENVKNTLLDPDERDEKARAAGLFAWQAIAFLVFSEMQGKLDFGARSYAVMDRKNYLDQSCERNVASTEIFFDADSDMLPTFIDALIAFEVAQELQGKAFLGYASLRFTGSTRATLGMQRHYTTCAVEVAGLKDVSGSEDLVTYAAELGIRPPFGGIPHWGQQNVASRDDIERIFGNPAEPTRAPIESWRRALREVTHEGARDAFSSKFTRDLGLEPF